MNREIVFCADAVIDLSQIVSARPDRMKAATVSAFRQSFSLIGNGNRESLRADERGHFSARTTYGHSVVYVARDNRITVIGIFPR